MNPSTETPAAAKAPLGTRHLPGFPDRLLGRRAVDGQHGTSAQWWANTHRVLLIVVASVIWALARLMRRQRVRERH